MTTMTVQAIFTAFYLALFLGNFLGIATFLKTILFTLPPKRQQFKTLTNGLSPRTIATRFAPIIKQSRSLRGPPPTETWYEVMPVGPNRVRVNYRVKWPAEIHPHRVVDVLYRAFRRFYYGSSEDIEIIQMLIDLKAMKVVQIKIETDSSNDPDVFISDHAKVTLQRTHDDIFEIKKGKKIIGKTKITFRQKHPIIEVLTWNHVFALKYSNEPSTYHHLPLRPLTDNLYQRYRLDRRSHFDVSDKHSTHQRKPITIRFAETMLFWWICMFSVSLLLLLVSAW